MSAALTPDANWWVLPVEAIQSLFGSLSIYTEPGGQVSLTSAYDPLCTRRLAGIVTRVCPVLKIAHGRYSDPRG